MTILKIAVIVFITIFMSMIIKEGQKQIHILLVTAVSLMIVIASCDKIGSLIAQITRITMMLKNGQDYITLLLKILGITYITQFITDLCRDNGYKTLADQIEIFARITIAIMSIPVILSLFDLTLLNVSAAQNESYAEYENNSDTTVNFGDDYTKDYDFSTVESAIKRNDIKISFKDIVIKVVNDNYSLTDVISIILKNTSSQFLMQKDFFREMLLLAVFSSVVSLIIPAFDNKQAQDIAVMIINIMLISLLSQCFVISIRTTQNSMESITDIYKSLIPVFMAAVMASSGSLASASGQQMLLLSVTAVNLIFTGGLLVLIKADYLLCVVNCISGKKYFARFCGLLRIIIKWTGRITVMLFGSLGYVKSLTSASSDSMKRKILYKSVKSVPGVGDALESMTQTVLDAGIVIKNGIGIAGFIIILIAVMVPLMKLAVSSVVLKFISAVIEPVTEKNFSEIIDNVSILIGFMAYILFISSGLFVIMIAIICRFTGSV